MTFKIKFLLSVLITISYFSYAQIHQNNKNVITDSLHSTILKENRNIYIKLPESYSTTNSKKYPVVYILDGELLFSTLNLVHSYYSGGFMPEMVLVGISNANNRSRDLTTSFDTSFYQKNGEANNFTSFFQNELIPYIEKTYPVTNYRTLIGHSYGGLFTINALINHSDVFDNYLAIDPSLDWDSQKLLKQAKNVLSHKNYTGKSLFISLGGQLHMSNPKITIENVMKDTTSFTIFPRSNITFFEQTKKNTKNGLTTSWKYYPNDLHGTVPLPSIKDGLISLFKWYQWENTSAFNNPNTSVKKVKKFIKHREEKLKKHFGYSEPPYGEDIFNMMGYMNIDLNQLEKSLMYFKMATYYYPKSPNAFDSLAEFYFKQKKYKKALKNITKAYHLSGKEVHKKKIKIYKNKLLKK